MNKSQKWSMFFSVLLLISSLLQLWTSHLHSSTASATASAPPLASTTARDATIIANLKRATSAHLFRSSSIRPELIALSPSQRTQIISHLCFFAPNCLPATQPTPKAAKDDKVCFYFDSKKGPMLIVLDLNGATDFYGDAPKQGARTNAVLCPESGRDLRNFLIQYLKLRHIFASK